jgi:hypothetical protein
MFLEVWNGVAMTKSATSVGKKTYMWFECIVRTIVNGLFKIIVMLWCF